MTGRLLPTTLLAEDLWSKFGFGDGDPFEFEDRGQEFDDAPPHDDWMLMREALGSRRRHDLLELLIRRHLLPAIAEATGETPETTRIQTHHNPVRDARFNPPDGEHPAGWENIAVDVSREQVLTAASEIIARTA